MTDISSNNKRIAKNTLYMYLRMFITMGVSLYTSRVVLRTLGVEDYGLYNVIGGIIAMFGFLNGAMTNTTSRYITFFLGKGDEKKLSDVFSMSFIIHACIAIIIIVLGETVGLWYLYEKLVIPEGRFQAAFWLYQLSIASTVASILYVPYNASIVAHEKMSAFAYISIFDSILKLLAVFALMWAPYDKLIFYGTLMFFIPLIDIAIYFSYCRRHFCETKLHWFWDASLFKEMFGFAGWSLLGNFSFVFYTQGINLILNAFCGPAVNAARGIAVQVEGVVRQFASNVQTALNPQIIKSYAENNMNRMYDLIIASSRYCFYLLLLLSLPVMIEADAILKVWLGDYPEHTQNFLRLILSIVMLDGMINPMFTANLATGKVKIYHIVISALSYGFMPITYLSIKYTEQPEIVFVCQFVMCLMGLIARLFIMKNQIGLSIWRYTKEVVLRNILVVFFSFLPSIYIFNKLSDDIVGFLITCGTSIICVIVFVFVFGMNNKEKCLIINKLRRLKDC